MHAARAEEFVFAERLSSRVALYLNPDLAAAVSREDMLRLPAILEALPGRPTRQRGRATSWRWRPQWHAGPGLMVRLYAHGGLLGPVLGTRFLGPGRMLNEFRLTILAHSLGVPTAVPVALRVERTCGPLVRAHYVSEVIPEAVDLLALLSNPEPAGDLSPYGRRRLAASVAGAVAAMHDVGICHGDLNLRNLLVRRALDAPETFVIDFDKAKRHEDLTLRQRTANLLRLDRSVMKRAASRNVVTRQDRLRVLRHYFRRYPRWRDEWRRIARGGGGLH